MVSSLLTLIHITVYVYSTRFHNFAQSCTYLSCMVYLSTLSAAETVQRGNLGKTGRFTFVYTDIFQVKMFFFLQYNMSLVILIVKGHK
jgi:hypothetical protein